MTHLGDTPVGMSGRVLRGRFNWKREPHLECCFCCLVDMDPRLRKQEKNGRDQLNISLHLSLLVDQSHNSSVWSTCASVPSLPWWTRLSHCEPGWTLLPHFPTPQPSFTSAAIIKYSDGKEVKGGRGLFILNFQDIVHNCREVTVAGTGRSMSQHSRSKEQKGQRYPSALPFCSAQLTSFAL